MLLIEETVAKFGYSPVVLSKGSHRRVLRKCDRCGRIDEVEFRQITSYCLNCSLSINNNREATSKRLKKMWLEGDPRYCSYVPAPPCSVVGCGQKHAARGFCQKHYDALPERQARRNSYNAKRREDPTYRIQQSAKVAAGIAERRKNDPMFRARDNARSTAHVIGRLKTNPLFKFKHGLRTLFRASFRQRGFKKGSRTAQILGCDFETAMKYIGWFPGCHIHHIIFLNTAITEEDIIRLNHYTNLKAMTKEEHKQLHKLQGKDTD